MAVAAGIAAAMTTNSHPQVPASPQNLFLLALGELAVVLRKSLLPHLAAGLGLFLMTAYVTYAFLLQPLHLPRAMTAALAGGIFLLYGLLSFAYSAGAACVFAIRAACITWESFIDDVLGLVKEKVASKIDNMNEGLAKDQAKAVVAGSVREVVVLFKRKDRKSLVRWLSALLLGVLAFALRSVLVARIIQAAGTTVQLSKLFAGRATLVGAVFLNLRFFSTVLLSLVYAAGAGVVLFNFLFVFWIK